MQFYRFDSDDNVERVNIFEKKSEENEKKNQSTDAMDGHVNFWWDSSSKLSLLLSCILSFCDMSEKEERQKLTATRAAAGKQFIKFSLSRSPLCLQI